MFTSPDSTNSYQIPDKYYRYGVAPLKALFCISIAAGISIFITPDLIENAITETDENGQLVYGFLGILTSGIATALAYTSATSIEESYHGRRRYSEGPY